MEMDRAALLAVCKQHRLYQTPHLNDKLYCNFKGFTSISGLEPYTGLRALFLEGNALETTEGLPSLPNLKCLFLQQNLLSTVPPSLAAAVPQLDTLNVSSNQLTDLSGLAGCSQLHTLIAADNRLAGVASVASLAQCAALESIDLQNNKLEDAAVLEVFSQLPSLKCLYLRGNPLVSAMRSYRKTVIAAIPTLTYLDDRPVFEVERLCAEAWSKGGLDAEREARAAYLEREMEREKQRVHALKEIREAGWKKQREARGMESGSVDPYLEGVSGEWEPDEEPAELREARERLAAFMAAKQQQEQLPGLVEADVRVVLEDSEATQAALLQSSNCANGGSGQPPADAVLPTVENSCPNNAAAQCTSTALAGLAASQTLPAVPAAVPEARVTVVVGGNQPAAAQSQEAAATEGQEAGGDNSPSAAGMEQVRVQAGSVGMQAGAEHQAQGETETDSDDEGSASVASSEDCLDELD